MKKEKSDEFIDIMDSFRAVSIIKAHYESWKESNKIDDSKDPIGSFLDFFKKNYPCDFKKMYPPSPTPE